MNFTLIGDGSLMPTVLTARTTQLVLVLACSASCTATRHGLEPALPSRALERRTRHVEVNLILILRASSASSAAWSVTVSGAGQADLRQRRLRASVLGDVAVVVGVDVGLEHRGDVGPDAGATCRGEKSLVVSRVEGRRRTLITSPLTPCRGRPSSPRWCTRAELLAGLDPAAGGGKVLDRDRLQRSASYSSPRPPWRSGRGALVRGRRRGPDPTVLLAVVGKLVSTPAVGAM